MIDPRELLDGIAQRADLATEGPWDPIDGNEGTGYSPMWMLDHVGQRNARTCGRASAFGRTLRPIMVLAAPGVEPSTVGPFLVFEYSDRMVVALRAVLNVIDGQHEYTCESSWLVGQIRNVITEALGGAQ